MVQAQRCQELFTGRSNTFGAAHSGEPQTKGMIRIPIPREFDLAIEAVQSGSATVGGFSGLATSKRQAHASDPGFLHQLEVRAVGRALRRDPDEALRQIRMRRRGTITASARARIRGSCGSSPYGTGRGQSSGPSGRRTRFEPRSEIIAALGAWRSLVARTVRVGEVPGSNPGAPIIEKAIRPCTHMLDNTTCRH